MIKQKNINNRYVTLQHQLHFVSLRHIEAHKTTYIFFLRYYEMKTQLLDTCEDDLLKIAEYEKAEESQEEDISNEHQ